MTLPIILGCLVGIVAIFLIVVSILDRKKQKKIKAEKKVLDIAIENSKTEVSLWMNEIFIKNKKYLDNFVPSIGKYKMSQLREAAKKAVKNLIDSREYKLAHKEQGNKDVVDAVKSLYSVNSNVWAKSAAWKVISKEVNACEKKEHQDFIKAAQKRVMEVFNEYTK